MNRKQFFSPSDRTNTQYKITIIPITKDLQKEEQKFQLTPSNYLPIIKEINFAKKVSQKNNTEDLLCGNIFNIGLMKDSSTSLTKENVKQTDFLFLDFEEPKKGSTKKVLTFARCLEILENNKCNCGDHQKRYATGSDLQEFAGYFCAGLHGLFHRSGDDRSGWSGTLFPGSF